ncbi:TetR/AcrR family transcriptional regulator [Streptomyces griseoloalbus]|uniref:TetR/AcrR family transcriptional regulator n=1 Tax=Streptomyces griseoloalbus TaxID=67303 RepID=A0ABV3E5W6_9ACTN
MPRPRNQAERRAQLIDAAARAVISTGATALKLRDVAAEAKVTPASVLYYYSDLQELFSAVFEHAAATYLDTRKEAIAVAEGPVEQLRACIRSGVPWPGAGEQSTRLLFELFPVALRNEAVGQAHQVFVDQQTDLYRQVLAHGEDSGHFTLTATPRALGRSFVALEDGYAMDLLIGTATAAEIETRLLAHARTATGSPAFA